MISKYNKYLFGFQYASCVCGVLTLIYFNFGSPTENYSDWIIIKPHIGNSITKKIVSSFFSCFFHGNTSHLISNISLFLIFGSYTLSNKNSNSIISLLIGAILPGLILYYLPHDENGAYFGFSGVVSTSIGYSLILFLRTDINLTKDYTPTITFVKILISILILNYYLGAGFWGTMFESVYSENIAWQIHLSGLIIGFVFAISDKESTWKLIFGNKITSEEKEKILDYYNKLKNNY